METFKEYLTGKGYGYSFRETINELTDVELEERVQDYLRKQLKNCNLQHVSNAKRTVYDPNWEMIQTAPHGIQYKHKKTGETKWE